MPQHVERLCALEQGAQTVDTRLHLYLNTSPAHHLQQLHSSSRDGKGCADLICHAQEGDAISDYYVEEMPLLRV